MTCRNCNCRRKYGNDHYCIGVKTPFRIYDLDKECTEYEYKRDKTNSSEDGIYFEVFALKDGVRYSYKIINLKDVSTQLTNSLMDGIQELVK